MSLSFSSAFTNYIYWHLLCILYFSFFLQLKKNEKFSIILQVGDTTELIIESTEPVKELTFQVSRASFILFFYVFSCCESHFNSALYMPSIQYFKFEISNISLVAYHTFQVSNISLEIYDTFPIASSLHLIFLINHL